MSGTMRDLDISATLTARVSRELFGDRYDVCFHETKVTHIPFDKSRKQGGKESPSIFKL